MIYTTPTSESPYKDGAISPLGAISQIGAISPLGIPNFGHIPLPLIFDCPLYILFRSDRRVISARAFTKAKKRRKSEKVDKKSKSGIFVPIKSTCVFS